MNRKKTREYDIKRYQEISEKLKEGFRHLKKQQKRNGNNKKVTKYALSKYTGVSRTAIDNHPEILELIRNEDAIKIDHINVKKDKIYSKNEAMFVIDELNDRYNILVEKVNKYKDINLSLNNQIVNLKKEKREYEKEIKRYKEKFESLRENALHNIDYGMFT